MKHALQLLAFLVITTTSQGSDFVMRNFGSFDFTGDGYSVRIELAEGDNNGLAPKIIFLENGMKRGVTGIGEGSYFPIVAGRWAVEFRPPHELWVYDGKANLQLYERTPKGFKSSSSSVISELFTRAPDELKKLIVENTSATKNESNKRVQATGVPPVPDP